MLKKNNKGFTLVEIMISTIILGTGVFGVYKLIGANMSVISSMSNDITADSILLNTKECIKNIGYDSFSGGVNKFSINFGSGYTKCFTGAYNTNYTFSGINIDNLEYFVIGEIYNSGSISIDFNLNIESDSSKTLTGQYTIYK